MSNTFYFAYGSNLDPAQMARRCGGARPVGAAMLMDHDLAFPRTSERWDGGGVAGAAPDPGAVVDGAAYEVTDDHLRTLDDCEGVAAGCYRREWKTIMLAGTGPTKAWVYFAEPDAGPRAGESFAPAPTYAATVLRGATHFKLDVLARKMRRAIRGDDRPAWDVEALCQPPVVRPAGMDEPGVESVYIDGLPWRGKPTRAFAFVGMPDATDRRVPGVVLVHGGGGTAFADWVRRWNARGYAAIAVDCQGGCGKPLVNGERPRHEHAGPPGWGGFSQLDEPIEDQWPYHAVATMMLAHSALAARPGVDARRIGLTGISWGGFQASIVAGIDPRLKWCVPVYGCAFPTRWTIWSHHPEVSDADRRRWSLRWDPARWLVDARCPMRWVSSPEDFAFPATAIDRSTQLPARPAGLSLRVGSGHGQEQGQAPGEIEAFAEQHARGGRPMLRIDEQHAGDRVISVRCAGQSIARAELCIADEAGPWIEAGWRTEPASVEGDTATAPLPRRWGGAYLNVYDDRGLATSGHVVVGPNE